MAHGHFKERPLSIERNEHGILLSHGGDYFLLQETGTHDGDEAINLLRQVFAELNAQRAKANRFEMALSSMMDAATKALKS